MAEPVVNLEVTAGLGAGGDAEELEQAAVELRQELLELDVEEVRPLPGPPAPEGARAGETAIMAALAVTAGHEAIVAAVRAVAGWLTRDRGRTARLRIGDDEIELTDASAEDQRRLLEAFLSRHAGRPE